MSFARNMGKNLNNKYGQKILDSTKKPTTDAIKTVSKRAIQKTAEAIGDLIGNKIVNKITSVSKKSSTELHSKKLENDNTNNQIEVSKKDTYLQKKDNKYLMN